MKKLWLVSLAAVLLLTGTMTGCSSDRKGGESGESENMSEHVSEGVSEGEKKKVSTADFTYRIDIDPYRSAIETDNPGYLTLVNKTHPVGKDFSPKDITVLDTKMTFSGKEVKLESTAARAVEAMVREMWANGWTDIQVTSGYRTYEYQSLLFNKYIDDEQRKHPDWSTSRCEQEVLTYSARPGTSEHQTGLCVDLIVSTDPRLDESFASHPAYAWLQANAFKFGFILRFPQGKDSVTGYTYEPWHYRFVGIDAAKQIHDAGLTLEEYLDR